MDRRQFLSLAAVAGAFKFADARALRAAEAPQTVVVDYAYYNPVSLLLKKKGWLEAELAKDGIGLRCVLSLGSNKALEFLRGGSIDFGSTAGSAAIVRAPAVCQSRLSTAEQILARACVREKSLKNFVRVPQRKTPIIMQPSAARALSLLSADRGTPGCSDRQEWSTKRRSVPWLPSPAENE